MRDPPLGRPRDWRVWSTNPPPSGAIGKAPVIKEQLFGTAHPELAVTLNNLGAHYLDCGDPRAASLLDKALALFQAQLGARHPSTIACRQNTRSARRRFRHG